MLFVLHSSLQISLTAEKKMDDIDGIKLRLEEPLVSSNTESINIDGWLHPFIMIHCYRVYNLAIVFDVLL